MLAAALDVLVSELPREQADALLDKVGRRVGLSAGGRAFGRLEDRVAAPANALRALGGEIDVVTAGDTLHLQATGCPRSSTVSRRPETCRTTLSPRILRARLGIACAVSAASRSIPT